MSDVRSKFREELERYKEMVTASPLSSRYDTELSQPSTHTKSAQKIRFHEKLTLASSESGRGNRSERWFQRYPASVVARFQAKEKGGGGLFEGKGLDKRDAKEAKPTKDSGFHMETELETMKNRFEASKAESANDRLLIAHQRDEIAKLKALLTYSNTELLRLQHENAALKAQSQAEDPGSEQRLITTLAGQLLSLSPKAAPAAPRRPHSESEDRPMRRTNNLH